MQPKEKRRRRRRWRTLLSVTAGLVLGIVGLPLVQSLAGHDVELPEEAGYPINSIIQQIRAELRAAEDHLEKTDESARFVVDHLDLELAFTVARSNKSNAAAKFQLLAVGSDTAVSAERVQRIRLHLKGLHADAAVEASAFGVEADGPPPSPEGEDGTATRPRRRER